MSLLSHVIYLVCCTEFNTYKTKLFYVFKKNSVVRNFFLSQYSIYFHYDAATAIFCMQNHDPPVASEPFRSECHNRTREKGIREIRRENRYRRMNALEEDALSSGRCGLIIHGPTGNKGGCASSGKNSLSYSLSFSLSSKPRTFPRRRNRPRGGPAGPKEDVSTVASASWCFCHTAAK